MPMSKDTYQRLKKEIDLMPEAEVERLPPDLKDWIFGIRPELKWERVKEKSEEQLLPKKTRGVTSLDIAQQKQLSEFLASLSLPSPFLTQLGDFFNFVHEDTEDMAIRLYRGECPLHYVPPFVSHLLFAQAKEIFRQETVWSELEKFVADFNNKLLRNCSGLWQSIYRDAVEGLEPSVKLDKPWYRFVSFIYEDATAWVLGKNLTLVIEKDYDYGGAGDKEFVVRCWSPQRLEVLTEFECQDRNEADNICLSIRESHIALRRKYRESTQVKSLTNHMYELEYQRENIAQALKRIAVQLRSM